MDDKQLQGFIILGNSQYKVDFEQSYNDLKNYCEKDLNINLSNNCLYYFDNENDKCLIESEFDYQNFLLFLKERKVKYYIQLFISPRTMVNNNNIENNINVNNNLFSDIQKDDLNNNNHQSNKTNADLINLLNPFSNSNINDFIRILNNYFKKRIFHLLKNYENISKDIYKSLNKEFLKVKPMTNGIFKETLNTFNNGINIIEEESMILKSSVLKSLYKSINLNIHRNIKCENCNQKPIIGIRFKCLECKEYNLCDNCMSLNDEKNFHIHDSFKKIRKEIVNNNKTYSYLCEDDLTFIYNKNSIKRTQNNKNVKIAINTVLKNNGNKQWPEDTIFKYDKIKSTIKCNDCKLPCLPVNSKTAITIIFPDIKFIPLGEYECFINFICNGEVYNDPLVIKITLN